MITRYQFLAVALPFSALLLISPARAETAPPLTVVEEDVLPQNIVPTKMAAMGDTAPSEAPLQLAQLTQAGMQEALATPERRISKVGTCTSHNISWQRSCADAGYPESYTGFIRGETQLDCAANEQRDVWLANSCAAPVALAQALPREAIKDHAVTAAVKPVPAVIEKISAPQLAVAMATPEAPVAPRPVKEKIIPPAPVAAAPEAVPDATSGAAPVAAAAVTSVATSVTGIDGQCGTASKALRIEAPTTDLCLSGTAAAVVGQGPWQWSCQGLSGGKSDTCIAMVDMTALSAKQKALLAAAPAPKPAVPVAAVAPVAAAEPDLPPVVTEPPQLAAAPGLSTPQLATPSLTAELSTELTTQTAPLTTAALATPQAGSTDYAPAEPVRASGTLQPRAGNDSAMIDAALVRLQFVTGHEAPDEAVLAQLETLGQKLALNRMAKITVTAYANTDQDTDARAARRLSLARAFAVRDALMLGGASSDQIRIRALGANGSGGDLDRAELTEN